MESILKTAKNAERLLKLTSDTMILLDKDGVCVDIAIYNVDLWFMTEEKLQGKNLFRLIPVSYTHLSTIHLTGFPSLFKSTAISVIA